MSSVSGTVLVVAVVEMPDVEIGVDFENSAIGRDCDRHYY